MTSFSLSIDKHQLVTYVNGQLRNSFPDGGADREMDLLAKVLPKTLQRVQTCFSKIKSRYFRNGNKVYFNHLNGDHYSMFLYILSNELYLQENDENIASKVFLLNKMMFGIDAFYKIELPEYFQFIHPLGTILGNAKYKNYFVVYQGVTVGSKIDGVYPEFGERNILYSNSSVLGNCKLGSNCVLAAKSFLLDSNVPDNHVVVNSHPNNKVMLNSRPTIDYYFYFD